jgi:serine phosphatase RsbU (regulator of sigma subunit)
LITELQPSTVVIAHALLASRGHSDVVERIRGASSLSLAATIQYELLPYPTFTANGIDLGGKIEPAYDIAGDAFDYALNREGIHLAIFDAMGHGLRSTLLTSLVVGAYRLERRAGAGLPDVAVAIDRVVAAHARAEFVTGVLLFLDPAEGVVEVWNGGHLPPVLVRNRRAQAIEAEEALLPFGLGPETAAPTRVALQPDDNLFLYTDGVVQAKDGDDQFWGAERFVDLVTGRVDDRLPMFQICRQVLDTLGTFVGGSLQDDATVVGLRWSPPI